MARWRIGFDRLGNVGGIAALRSMLADSDQEFPVLLTKVLYNGTHGGDSLPVSDVAQLHAEIRCLSDVHASEQTDEAILREFEKEMTELVAASIRVQKPIAF